MLWFQPKQFNTLHFTGISFYFFPNSCTHPKTLKVLTKKKKKKKEKNNQEVGGKSGRQVGECRIRTVAQFSP